MQEPDNYIMVRFPNISKFFEIQIIWNVGQL